MEYNERSKKFFDYLKNDGYKLNFCGGNHEKLAQNWVKDHRNNTLIGIKVELYCGNIDYYHVTIISTNNVFYIEVIGKYCHLMNTDNIDGTIKVSLDNIDQINQFLGYCESIGYLLDKKENDSSKSIKLRREENRTKLITICGSTASFSCVSKINGIETELITEYMSFRKFIDNYRYFSKGVKNDM